MERENMKGKIALTVIGAATLLVALAGATFAYFSATSVSEQRQITTSSMNLTVAINGSSHITNIKPTTWTSVADVEDNKDIAVIPFTVTGDSESDGTYTVNMQTSIALNTGTDADGKALVGGEIADIKYRLFKGDQEVVTERAFAGTTNVDIVENGTITAGSGVNDSYVLYVYIKDNGEQNKLQNINFTISLGGTAEQA